MKQTIFHATTRQQLISRVANLKTDSKGKWGRLNSTQMIRHLTEGGRMAFGEIIVPDQSNFITRSLLKWLFLSNIKPPGREKGKIKTFPQIDIVALAPSLAELEIEKQSYFSLLERMAATNKLSAVHPLFGKMKHDDWGYLTYAHADYHFTQFHI